MATPLDLAETARDRLLVLDPDLSVRLADRSLATHSQSPQRIPLAIRRANNETQSKAPVRSQSVLFSKVNGGRAIHDYRKDKIVFRQGDPADAVFYIQKGKIKLTVVSERGKEAVVGILEPVMFRRRMLMAIRFVSQRLQQSINP